MQATIIRHDKVTNEQGNTVEIKLWKVPASLDKPKGYKYSLVYIVEGQRVIGYDNSERKGDHRHSIIAVRKGPTGSPHCGNSRMIFWLMWNSLKGTYHENKKDQNRV